MVTCNESAASRLRSMAARTTPGACTTSVKATASFSSRSAWSGRQYTPTQPCPRSSCRWYVPEGEAIGTNPITAAEEVEGKLLPLGEEGENDVQLLEDDGDVEFLGGGGKEGDIAG